MSGGAQDQSAVELVSVSVVSFSLRVLFVIYITYLDISRPKTEKKHVRDARW